MRTHRSKRGYNGQNSSTFLLKTPFTPFTPFFNDEALLEKVVFVWLRFFLGFHAASLNEGVNGGENMGTKFGWMGVDEG